MEEDLERKRLKYKEIQNERRKELQKTIYNNSDWIDKIKIRLRMFFESLR
jgi:hypothetical protein